MRYLFVSPHLDDVVLSCALWMMRLREAGHELSVVSIFTEGPGYEVRREDDRRALARLGATPTHLGLLDAPYRDAQYCDIEAIVFGEPTAEDIAARSDAADRLLPLVASVDQVVLPLGVGEHIDHRLTHEMALGESLFYEDRPYALWEGLTEARLRRLGMRADSIDLRATIDEVSFTRRFVPEGPVRERCLRRYEAWLDGGGGLHDAEVALCAARDEAEVVAIWETLHAYRSETPPIYPSRAAFFRENARHADRAGARIYAERRWRRDRRRAWR